MRNDLSIPENLLPEIEKSDYFTAIGVQWGEMNAARHVSNVTFFRWFETARMDYFLHLDSEAFQKSMTEGFMVGSQEIKYFQPVFYPDQVFLALYAHHVEHDRFSLECRMFSRTTGKMVAVANCKMVMYDFVNHEKKAIPQHLREKIESRQNPTAVGS